MRSQNGLRGWSESTDDGAYDRFNEFLSSARSIKPGLMLDAGCGGGELCIQLSQQGWKTIGVDYAETALQLAHQNANSRNIKAWFARADLTDTWPVPENRFDLVVDNHVLHCLTDLAHRSAFLTNAHRALKPGGLVFSANMSSEGELDLDRFTIDPATGIDHNNTRIWVSKHRLCEEFRDAGFVILECRTCSEHQFEMAGDEVVVEAQKLDADSESRGNNI